MFIFYVILISLLVGAYIGCSAYNQLIMKDEIDELKKEIKRLKNDEKKRKEASSIDVR